MGFLDDDMVSVLNDAWAHSEPERIHQSLGDRIKLRLEVRHPGGDVSKWSLRLGQGERVLTRGAGFMPDALVLTDEDTIQRVLTSEDPAALKVELAAGTIRLRGNTDKLYENLGDVLAISDGPTRVRMRAYQAERTSS